MPTAVASTIPTTTMNPDSMLEGSAAQHAAAEDASDGRGGGDSPKQEQIVGVDVLGRRDDGVFGHGAA